MQVLAQTVYFERAGQDNTEHTLELARKRANELGIDTIIVATTSGETGARAVEVFGPAANVIVVTHEAGYRGPNTQELTPENRTAIEAGEGTS